MRENMRASECVISRVSRVLQEARKREIVGSIVGNNGTPKLPFPTSSSLATCYFPQLRRFVGFSTPSSTFVLAYFALILMCRLLPRGLILIVAARTCSCCMREASKASVSPENIHPYRLFRGG